MQKSIALLKSFTTLLTLIFIGNLEAAQKPNVLMIIVDDLKPTMGCFGDTLAITPHMDRLASQGMIYSNNHCQQAVCGPSRASLLTGLLPNNSKVWNFGDKMRQTNKDVLTLPQYFKQKGYYTQGMGKVFDGRCCDGWGPQDRISWSTPLTWAGGKKALGGYTSQEAVDKIAELKTKGLWSKKQNSSALLAKHGYKPSTECEDVPDDAYGDGDMTSKAINHLQNLSKKKQPFFFAVGYIRPHLPFTAPKKYWDYYDRDTIGQHPFRKRASDSPEYAYHNSGELRQYSDIPKKEAISEDKKLELRHGYYACVSYVDAQIGRLVKQLEELGIKDNTIICLWGDHGWHLGDHGMFCKHSNFEQATRSPLILSGYGVPKGVATSQPTEFLDVFPTLCDLSGLDIPPGLDGMSLSPLFEHPNQPLKPAARSQYPKYADVPLMGHSIRNERYRLTQWMAANPKKGRVTGTTKSFELYDYQEDPMETRNLANHPEYQKQRDQMKKTLGEMFFGTGSQKN
ncbi:MAG: sulfatase [Planctomycetes bacterium]|nr:sulfatase [Planctomycetota bacterium]